MLSYVLPQEEGHPIQLVVPKLLQLGWVKSPPYFSVATETVQDVATNYIEMPVNLLPQHKLEKYVVGDTKYEQLLKLHKVTDGFVYMVKVYVDDFERIVIPISQQQLWHLATAIMMGIHYVFPPDSKDSSDPISKKKLKQNKGLNSMCKTLL